MFGRADHCQVPVIVLGDRLLDDSSFAVDGLDPARIPIDRGEIIAQDLPGAQGTHKRYAITASAASLRRSCTACAGLFSRTAWSLVLKDLGHSWFFFK